MSIPALINATSTERRLSGSGLAVTMTWPTWHQRLGRQAISSKNSLASKVKLSHQNSKSHESLRQLRAEQIVANFKGHVPFILIELY